MRLFSLSHRSSTQLASTVLLTSVLLLGACTTAGQSAPVQEADTPVSQTIQSPASRRMLPLQVSLRVRRMAARQLGIPFRDVRIADYSQETWSDGCLGLGGPAELCMMALVKGWRVEVTNGEQTWTYRTDETAQQIRLEGEANQANLPAIVRDRVLQTAAQTSGLPVSALEIIRAEPRTWNGCLGIDLGPDQACTEIAIMGWRVEVKGEQQTWVYHTNDNGSDIRLNEQESQLSPLSPEPMSDQEMLQPMATDVVFHAISSGGITGQSSEIMLMQDGRILRSPRLSATPPTEMGRISSAQVQQFKTLLQQIRFRQFDRLSYPAPQGAADYITVTLMTQDGSTQYADIVQNQLPSELQQIIQAWQTMIQSS